jgi:hypothetical protein
VTPQETRIEAALKELTSVVSDLKEEVHVYIGIADVKFQAFEKLCNERHGLQPGRLARLEEEVKAEEIGAVSFRAKLQGMTAPIAVIVALLSILLSFLLHIF